MNGGSLDSSLFNLISASPYTIQTYTNDVNKEGDYLFEVTASYLGQPYSYTFYIKVYCKVLILTSIGITSKIYTLGDTSLKIDV